MNYSPRVLPEGCFALLSLIVGVTAYWMLGLGYTELPLSPRLNISLLHALVTLLSTIPAVAVCARWGERKSWAIIVAILMTAITWILLFLIIVAPAVHVAAFRAYFGEDGVVEQALFVSAFVLVLLGVIAALLATYTYRYAKAAKIWARMATIVACLFFVAVVGLLPLD